MLSDFAPLDYWAGLSSGQFVALIRFLVPSIGYGIKLKKEWERLTGKTLTVSEWNEIRGATPVTTPVPALPSSVDGGAAGGDGADVDEADEEAPTSGPASVVPSECDAARMAEAEAQAAADASRLVVDAWRSLVTRADPRSRRFLVEGLQSAQRESALLFQALSAAKRARRAACQGM